MATHSVYPSTDTRSPVLERSSTQSGGREVSRCSCISQKTLFTIMTIVGSILLILGVIALAGYFAPTSGGGFADLLQKINSTGNFVATKLGSDLFTLSMFTVSFGAAFTFCGSVGLCINKCEHNDAKKRFQNRLSESDA